MTVNTERGGTKRPSSSSFEPAPIPVKRGRYENQAARIVIINDFQQASKNVVWMCQPYVNILFNTVNTALARYVSIADRIYRVGINNVLHEYTIGLNTLQRGEIEGSIFSNNDTSLVWVNPHELNENTVHSMHVTIEEYGCETIYPISIKLADLAVKISQVFNRNFVFLGQQWLLPYKEEKYLLRINQTSNTQSHLSPAYVNGATQIEIKACYASPVTLIDEVIEDKTMKPFFNLELQADHHSSCPIIVERTQILDKIYHTLDKKEIVVGHTLNVTLAHNNKVKLTLEKVEYQGKTYGKPIKDKEAKIVQKAFRLDKKPQIFFNKNSDIILIAPNVEPARALDLEIHHIFMSAAITDPYQKIYWIDLSKVEEHLRNLTSGICKGQKLEMLINETKIKIRVLNGYHKDPYFIKPMHSGRLQWMVDPATEFRFCSATSIRFPLVDNAIPRTLSKVKFKILPMRREGTFPVINVEESKMIEAIRAKVTVPFIRNQTFQIPLPTFDCKVIVEQMLCTLAELTKPNHGFLGQIVEKTIIKVNSDVKQILLHKEGDKDPIERLEEYNLAAISKEFKSIARSIIIQHERKEVAQALNVAVERGLILYGPPGNGKTRLAEALADMLGCTKQNGRLISISGTSIFDMWVGGSEANVRALFRPASEAYEKFGDASELYVTVIDEIDGLLSQRRGDHNRVNDKVVNEFLSCIDGPIPLNNLLVIGTTNRAELLDEAALRHGRFGKKVAIGNPDQKGRQQIIELYLKPLRQQGALDEKIDCEKLAKETENFSGADIKGVVEEAKRFALERSYEAKSSSSTTLMITKGDLNKAIAEVKPQKSSSQAPEGMYH